MLKVQFYLFVYLKFIYLLQKGSQMMYFFPLLAPQKNIIISCLTEVWNYNGFSQVFQLYFFFLIKFLSSNDDNFKLIG